MKTKKTADICLFFFLACLALPLTLFAEESGVSIRVANAPSKLSPLQAVTFSFLITNKNDRAHNFEEQVKLPTGWPLLISSVPFSIEAGDSDVRLVSFQVPAVAAAGNYDIVYRIEDTVNGAAQELAVQVSVSPFLALSILAVRYPNYVIAGEDYEVTFSLQNRSNIALTLSLACEAESKYPVLFAPTSVFLAPGDSSSVNATVKTDASLNRPTRHWVKLTAHAVGSGGEELVAEARSWVDLIPRISGDTNLYHLFPTTLKMKTHESQGTGSLQFEYTGKGTLKEYGNDVIEFSFISPYLTQGGQLSVEDFYFTASYLNPSTAIYVGDRSYYLSPLTRYQSYGRGIELSLFRANPFSLDGFYVHDWMGRNIGALSLGYSTDKDKKNGLFLHGLFSDTQGSITSLEGKAGIGLFKLEGEAAKGFPSGGAGRARVSGSGTIWKSSKWEAAAGLLYASALFPSSLHDMYQGSANLSLVPIKNIKLWGNYYREQRGLSLASPSLQESAQYGITWSPLGHISLSHLYWKWENPIASSPYSYQNDINRLSYSFTWNNIKPQVYYQWGAYKNNIKDTKEPSMNVGASLSYSVKDWNASVYYSQALLAPVRYGASANVEGKLAESLKAGLSFYFNKQDPWLPYYGGSAKLIWTFEKGGSFECATHGYYSHSTAAPNIDVSIVCAAPINIPVSKKKNIGSLQGRIYHALDGHEGIEGVILRVNGSTAVTDKNGNYIFPSLVAGTYYLEVDRATLGIGNLPMIKVPLSITVEEHQKKQIDIEVAKSASLRGRIAIFAPKEEGFLNNGNAVKNANDANGAANSGGATEDGPANSAANGANDNAASGANSAASGAANNSSPTNGESQLVEKSCWSGVTVMAKNAGQVFYAVTDKNGNFAFDELLPATWTLSILSEPPALHHLEQKTITLALEPGENCELPVWRVLPVSREMILLEEEELM